MTWAISLGSTLLILGVVFLTVLILPIALLWVVVRIFRGGDGGTMSNADEARMMQDIANGLRRMEGRLEALETLLLDGTGKEGGK